MIDLKKIDLIDKDITNNLTKVFKSKLYNSLLLDLKRSLYQHKSVFLVGLADLGRIAIQIEGSFRKFWLNLINIIPDRKDEFLANYNFVSSLPIGGDVTIINPEIDFKDLYMIGNRQVENEVDDGDICIIYGGKATSRAINQAAINASKRGASVYYLYDEAKEKIASIDVAKGIVSNKNIIKISLATEDSKCHLLKELIFTYSALEIISAEWLKENLTDSEYKVVSDLGYIALSLNDYAKCFNVIAKGCQKEKALKGLFSLSSLMSQDNIYLSHNYLCDILTSLVDNQVKSGLPTFKKRLDKSGEHNKDLVIDPLFPTAVAWQHIFRRSIKGLDESKNTYKLLGLNHPHIVSYHSSELFEYMIGYEEEASINKYNLVLLDLNENYENMEVSYFTKVAPLAPSATVLRIGNVSRNKIFANELIIPLKMPTSILDIFSHLLIKVLFTD